MGSYNPDIAIAQIANDPRVVGRLIRAGQFQTSTTGGTTHTAGAVGTGIYVPVDFGAGGSIDTVSVNVTTLGATSQYRMALYRPDSTGRPGQLQADLGALDVTATGIKSTTVAAQKVAGLMYLLAVPQGSNVAVVSGVAAATVAAALNQFIDAATMLATLFTGNVVAYSETSITAAPPATATPVASVGTLPVVGWRWSAIAQS